MKAHTPFVSLGSHAHFKRGGALRRQLWFFSENNNKNRCVTREAIIPVIRPFDSRLVNSKTLVNLQVIPWASQVHSTYSFNQNDGWGPNWALSNLRVEVMTDCSCIDYIAGMSPWWLVCWLLWRHPWRVCSDDSPDDNDNRMMLFQCIKPLNEPTCQSKRCNDASKSQTTTLNDFRPGNRLDVSTIYNLSSTGALIHSSWIFFGLIWCAASHQGTQMNGISALVRELDCALLLVFESGLLHWWQLSISPVPFGFKTKLRKKRIKITLWMSHHFKLQMEFTVQKGL